jgi:hypothetical protein
MGLNFKGKEVYFFPSQYIVVVIANDNFFFFKKIPLYLNIFITTLCNFDTSNTGMLR